MARFLPLGALRTLRARLSEAFVKIQHVTPEFPRDSVAGASCAASSLRMLRRYQTSKPDPIFSAQYGRNRQLAIRRSR